MPPRLSAMLFAHVQPSALPQLQTKTIRFQQKDQLTKQQLTVFRSEQVRAAAPAPGPAIKVAGPLLNRLPLMAVPHSTILPLRNLPINNLVAVAPTVAARPVVAALDMSRVPVGTRASSFRVPLAPSVRDHRTATVPPPVAPPPAAGPALATTTYPAMELLAFICRKLPPCPNPDPGLNWS